MRGCGVYSIRIYLAQQKCFMRPFRSVNGNPAALIKHATEIAKCFKRLDNKLHKIVKKSYWKLFYSPPEANILCYIETVTFNKAINIIIRVIIITIIFLITQLFIDTKSALSKSLCLHINAITLIHPRILICSQEIYSFVFATNMIHDNHSMVRLISSYFIPKMYCACALISRVLIAFEKHLKQRPKHIGAYFKDRIWFIRQCVFDTADAREHSGALFIFLWSFDRGDCKNTNAARLPGLRKIFLEI